jgi:hypothetical protein
VVAALAVGAAIALRPAVPPPKPEELRASLAAAVAKYRCGSLDYSLDNDGAVRLTGNLATTEDLEALRREIGAIRGIGTIDFAVGLRIWPFCEVALLLKPLVERNGEGAPQVSLANGEARIGDPLVLDIKTPGFDGYLYVDYLDGDGNILHLFPNDKDALNYRPARNPLVLGRPPMARCWTLGGNTGQQMVTVLAAPAPLFPARRPEVEAVRDVLPRLAQLTANAGQSTLAAAFLLFDLRDAAPIGGRGYECPSG